MIYTISLVVLLLAAFYKFVRHRQTYWNRMKVNSPNTTFLIGDFGDQLMAKRNTIEILEETYQKYKDTDRVAGMYQFLKPELIIIDPALSKEILVKDFSDFHDTSFGNMLHPDADPLLSRNPFFLSGQEWKDKRAEITPAFSPSRIKAMFPLIEDICVRIQTYLTEKQDVPIEARDLCSRYTCDVVSNCIFAADAESFTQETPKVRDMAKKIFDTSFLAIVKFTIVFLAPKFARMFRFRFVPLEVQNFFSKLMAQAVEQRRQLGITRQDYLEYLLQMQGKKRVSELELAANGITFFLDGFETSSIAIACTMFELAHNKDIQTRLRKELESVSSYDDLVDNEYLGFVFHEALRIHPPAGALVRECTNTIEMKVLEKDKKLRINKGDTVNIPVWSIHHDEKVYVDPEKFNPDRFANGELKRYKEEGLYLPFSAGPRMCIGQKFAAVQSKACIATLVKNFEIDVDSKTKLPLKLGPQEFITYYDGGLWLRFNKISK